MKKSPPNCVVGLLRDIGRGEGRLTGGSVVQVTSSQLKDLSNLDATAVCDLTPRRVNSTFTCTVPQPLTNLRPARCPDCMPHPSAPAPSRMTPVRMTFCSTCLDSGQILVFA